MSKKILLIKNNYLESVFVSYFDVAVHIGLDVDQHGYIIYKGENMRPRYCLNNSAVGWGNGCSGSEALIHWVENYMHKQLPEYAVFETSHDVDVSSLLGVKITKSETQQALNTVRELTIREMYKSLSTVVERMEMMDREEDLPNDYGEWFSNAKAVLQQFEDLEK